MVPVLGMLTNRTVHPPALDNRTRCTSMNHASLPTALLYTASGTGAFVVNYGIQATVAAKMSAAGIAGAATTTVSFLLPVAVGASAVCAYRYGPAIGSAIKTKATQLGTSVYNCFSRAANSLRSCSLWATPNRAAASGAAPAVGADIGVPLLPTTAAP